MAKSKNLSDMQVKPDDKWETQSALDTLIRSQEIMADKDLMKKVMKMAKTKKKAITCVQDLKDYAQEKYGAGSDDSDDEMEG